MSSSAVPLYYCPFNCVCVCVRVCFVILFRFYNITFYSLSIVLQP